MNDKCHICGKTQKEHAEEMEKVYKELLQKLQKIHQLNEELHEPNFNIQEEFNRIKKKNKLYAIKKNWDMIYKNRNIEQIREFLKKHNISLEKTNEVSNE